MMNLPFSLLANPSELSDASKNTREMLWSEVENRSGEVIFSNIFQHTKSVPVEITKADVRFRENAETAHNTNLHLQTNLTQDELSSEEDNLEDLRKVEGALLPKNSAKVPAFIDDSHSASPRASLVQQGDMGVVEIEALASASNFGQEPIIAKKTSFEPTFPHEADTSSHSSFVEIGQGRFVERPLHRLDPLMGGERGEVRSQFGIQRNSAVPHGVGAENPESPMPLPTESIWSKSSGDLSTDLRPTSAVEETRFATKQEDMLLQTNVVLKGVLSKKDDFPTQSVSPEPRERDIGNEVTAKLMRTLQLGEMRPPLVKTEATMPQASTGMAVSESDTANQPVQHVSANGRPDPRAPHTTKTRPESALPTAKLANDRQSVGQGVSLQSVQITTSQMTEVLTEVSIETEHITNATGVSEFRGGTFSRPQMNASPISRNDQASLIGRQLVDVSQQAHGKGVELTLNPEELGRVRMGITGVDGAITVSIMAERAETLDLMRRHMGQLAQEFRDIGYSDVSFAFDQQTEEQEEQPKNTQTDTMTNIEEVDDTLASVTLAITPGVDMRL